MLWCQPSVVFTRKGEAKMEAPAPVRIAGNRRGPILVQGGIHSIHRHFRGTLEVV
jgi:hypothetical protein